MKTADWRSYPFQLVPGDGRLEFPAAEGEHPDHESDTWFLAGQLDAATGRSFAFLTIFNKNRPGGSVVADFYTMALFDLDTGGYGTYTDYDMPPASLSPGARPKLSAAAGHLDIRYESAAGTASWTTCRGDDGQLLPYTYRLNLVGVDQAGQPMNLEVVVTPTRAPVPVGASTYDGKIACFGQDGTYSYFQTGMVMTGTLRWGESAEQVAGRAGHVDRQWFPKYAGGGGTGGDPRARSHEWRTINLDNGVDLSIWRQFDRTNRNTLQPFSGTTTSYPDPAAQPECAEDVEVTVNTYVRWPDWVRPLVPPRAAVRYLPDRHRITCTALQLDLTGEPLVAVPAHALPIEYMDGPYRYRGTLRGEPVSGFGFYERSLALYRDWELIDVLATAAANLDPPAPQLVALADRVRPLVVSGNRREALELVQAAADALPWDQAAGCREVLDALIQALSVDD
ncbi:MAG TPA: lipocalin-like domain-containing protein [Mycobacterium sp.]|nr:lipocalin-like domain-containing protein [Mycobacterium sp.]